MVLSPTEETPLVEGAEDKDFEEETQQSKVGGFQKYLSGFILIVAGLNGAYFLGKATSSDTGNNNNHLLFDDRNAFRDFIAKSFRGTQLLHLLAHCFVGRT